MLWSHWMSQRCCIQHRTTNNSTTSCKKMDSDDLDIEIKCAYSFCHINDDDNDDVFINIDVCMRVYAREVNGEKAERMWPRAFDYIRANLAYAGAGRVGRRMALHEARRNKEKPNRLCVHCVKIGAFWGRKSAARRNQATMMSRKATTATAAAASAASSTTRITSSRSQLDVP